MPWDRKGHHHVPGMQERGKDALVHREGSGIRQLVKTDEINSPKKTKDAPFPPLLLSFPWLPIFSSCNAHTPQRLKMHKSNKHTIHIYTTRMRSTSQITIWSPEEGTFLLRMTVPLAQRGIICQYREGSDADDDNNNDGDKMMIRGIKAGDHIHSGMLEALWGL